MISETSLSPVDYILIFSGFTFEKFLKSICGLEPVMVNLHLTWNLILILTLTLNTSFKASSFNHSFKVHSSNMYVYVIYVYKYMSINVCDSSLTSMATSSCF